MEIFNLSPFVKHQFTQYPLLVELLDVNLDITNDWLTFQNNHSNLDAFAITRKYRQSRLALIAAKDSLESIPQNHINTLKQISTLAKTLISFAYQHALNEMQHKYGEVVNAQGEVQNFIIFALGKLGGFELNYSSDVDLVFCYTDNGQSNGEKSLDAQRYFNRLGRCIIQILDSVTADGIVYRVDMRLRPFGSASPLTCSVLNLLNYLESEGRDWERYAWLRARFVAGDEQLAKNTLTHIQPFIYRKYLDYSIFESLRQIKVQIEIKQQNDKDNLKLGFGGIREIEFIIQTLQITFGGRNKELRGNNLWLQLHKLCEFNHISIKDLQQLTDSWLFLRKLENLCQIIHDRDSHHLPNNIDALAPFMNCSGSNDLLKQFNYHRNNTHSFFKLLFLSNKKLQSDSNNHPKIDKIKDTISQKHYPKEIKHKLYAALESIIPMLQQYNNESEIIDRFVQVISAVSRRPSYLSMLIESPIIVQKLVAHISHSQYFSTTIAKTPSLLELLFESIEDSDFDVKKQWEIFSNKHTIIDTERYLEILAQFKQRMHFLVVLAYVDKLNDAKISCKILTDVAELVLSLIIKLAWQNTQNKIESSIQVEDLIVIAYGSLAMKTMHLKSDFDIVFILAREINDNNHKFIMRWIKRIIHLLSIQSYSGGLYQLDTQLRPNGKSGAAIVSKTNFENYQKHQAWTWEHAALIKTRPVFATHNQCTWFNSLRKILLMQKRDPLLVNADLKEMSKKMSNLNKNHEDEFTKLANILINAHKFPELVTDIYKNFPNERTLKLDQSIY